MNEPLLDRLFPQLLIVIVPVFWVAMAWWFSRGGWKQLAEKYQTDIPKPKGIKYGYLTINDLITHSFAGTALTEQGLYIRGGGILFFHPSLLIPYSDLHDTGLRRNGFFRAYEIGSPKIAELAFGPYTNLRLREKLFDLKYIDSV